MTHELLYRAGLSGFGRADDTPHWYCSCGRWRIERKNYSPAYGKRHHKLHVLRADQEEQRNG